MSLKRLSLIHISRMLLITNYYKEWDGKNKGKFVNLYVICTGEEKGTGPFPENGGKSGKIPCVSGQKRVKCVTQQPWCPAEVCADPSQQTAPPLGGE